MQKEKGKKFYAIQQFGNEADVYIFGDITEYAWGDEDVTPVTFKEEINALDAETINIHINSYGGDVSAGWAIYSVLRQKNAKIKTYADGFVCSAALYPFLAGDERFANSVSTFYLHEVSTRAFGYAKDLRAAAEEAEKLTEIGINAFIERAGMQRETVEDLMQKETWLTPEEALNYGIATGIISSESENASQSALKEIIQKITQKEEHAEPVITEEPKKQQEKQKTEDVSEKGNEEPELTLMQKLAGIFND